MLGKGRSKYGLGEFTEWHGDRQINLKQAGSINIICGFGDSKVCLDNLERRKN